MSAATPDTVRLRIRVWLPDRPGALGLVASRIGSLGGDIVGIDVLERGERVAVDEFSVVVAHRDVVDLLVREIAEVDGATLEQCITVDDFADPRLDTLTTVEFLLAADNPDATLADRTLGEFDADWAAVIRDGAVTATAGSAPGEANLVALAAGTSASPLVASGRAGPDDLLVAPTGQTGSLLAGRASPPFRSRERDQVLALGRIAALLGERTRT